MIRSRLKVAYVIGALGIGGAERQLLKKMTLLRDQGLDLVVITLSAGGTLTDEFVQARLRVIQLPRTHSMEWSRIRRLIEVLRAEKPDVVHGEQYQAGAYARIAAVLAHVPIRIHAIRSAYPKLRWRYRAAESILKHFTDAYMVNAEAIKARTVAFHGIAPSRVHVIPNVFDPEERATRPVDEVRASLGLQPGDHTIGFVASLEPEKNHALFLEFASRVRARNPRAHFFIVGDGIRRPEVESRVKALDLEASVHLLGVRRDVPDLLQVFDVSVNCSFREGLCNALIESIAAGVPVLASRVGGNPEIVSAGHDGELFESNSLESMLSAYETLMRDLPRYRANIRGTNTAFLHRFSGDRVAQAMVEIYEACARRNGRPRS
jgi:glycosyltransferase involved in cell wall biosynthesis